MPPVILIVEDGEEYGEYFSRKLSGDFEVLWTKTQSGARELVESHRGVLALVVMDACVPGDNPNTQDLTVWVRSQVSGPIVACSSSPKWARDLLDYGATHTSDKLKLPDVVREILLVA